MKAKKAEPQPAAHVFELDAYSAHAAFECIQEELEAAHVIQRAVQFMHRSAEADDEAETIYRLQNLEARAVQTARESIYKVDEYFKSICKYDDDSPTVDTWEGENS
jgi:hypothetical protein